MGEETALGGEEGSRDKRAKRGRQLKKRCRRRRLIILLGPPRAPQERRRVRLPMCKQQM